MYRILAADDDPSIVHLIREMLKTEYDVLTASDGETALRLVREEKPDERDPGYGEDP